MLEHLSARWYLPAVIVFAVLLHVYSWAQEESISPPLSHICEAQCFKIARQHKPKCTVSKVKCQWAPAAESPQSRDRSMQATKEKKYLSRHRISAGDSATVRAQKQIYTRIVRGEHVHHRCTMQQSRKILHAISARVHLSRAKFFAQDLRYTRSTMRDSAVEISRVNPSTWKKRERERETEENRRAKGLWTFGAALSNGGLKVFAAHEKIHNSRGIAIY